MELGMSAQPQHHVTPEEYLAIERAAEFRSEYYDGVMYAMAGASFAHATIIWNLGLELGSLLRKSPCRGTSNEVRVRVSPERLYLYPDIAIVCGERRFADDQADTLLNPTFIIEVLSKSTEAFDRGEKFTMYRRLASLQEYVLVSQNKAQVEVYRRQPGADQWFFSEKAGLDASVRFESINCEILLAEIYRDVDFKDLTLQS